jgi:site-specific DNA recombinase
MKNAAIYARVSSAEQKQERTIASQTAALITYAEEHGYHVPREWIFEDEGFSGANLQRPGLERVRDLAAEGQLGSHLIFRTHLKRPIMVVEECHAYKKKILGGV